MRQGRGRTPSTLNKGSVCTLDFGADTGGDGLTHVTDSKPSERREFLCGLDDEGLHGFELDNSVVTVLEEGQVSEGLSSTVGGNDLDELTGNLCGVNVEHRGVSDSDDGGVVQHDDLSGEGLGNCGWVVNRSSDVSSLDVVLGNSTNVESDVVSRLCFGHGLVVFLDGFDDTSDVGRLEDDLHVGGHDSGLDTADRNGSDTGDGVNILNGDTEGLLGVLLRNDKGVKCLDKGRSVVPGGVGGFVFDVVSHVCGYGDEGDGVGLVSDHLEELDHSFFGLVVLGLVVFDCIHLVDGDDDLLDTKGGSKEDVLFGLSLGTLDCGAGDDCCVCLGGTGDHVLNEVTVSRSVDDGEEVLVGLEFLVGDVDSNSSLPLFLKSIHDPSEVEGSFSFLLGFFLVFFDDVGVDCTGLEKDPTGKGGFSVVDVSDDD